MGDSASQNLRRPERAYSPPHDTAQTRANWAGNPVASRSLDRCDAARACDARAKRRLYSPDDPPPSACESHTGHAGWSAPSEDRHHQGTSGCSAKQPDSPHPEQRTKCAPVEGRGRAHHPEPHLTIPLRLARSARDPPPPAKQVEATQRRGIASISPQDWGRWIARSCAQDGGGEARSAQRTNWSSGPIRATNARA
jgi:hypothetical protein